MSSKPSQADISKAYDLIKPHIRKTPLFSVSGAPFGLKQPVDLKLELLQKSGSFKARGAFYNLLSREVPSSGVAAASGGNHGAAVAHAAHSLGIPAKIFVPEISSPAKINKIKHAGAQVVVKGDRYADALGLCEAYQASSGAIGLHAYDGFHTICGQGTLGQELEEQWGGDLPDTLLVAVGGGGMISGLASWFGRRIKIVGVEPQKACALHQAMAASRPVDVDVAGVAADSLGAKRIGETGFEILQPVLDEVITIPDDAITKAQTTLWQDYHLASEAGGAAAFAALQSGAYKAKENEKVAIILCGSNVELQKLASLTESH
ncbi:MAG: threonine/serine dehydratase [Cohaesibacter sp.]|jgi:threonine dehydratase|nr:threonine/serine dehydratase [Cohaesibacter sp.]